MSFVNTQPQLDDDRGRAMDTGRCSGSRKTLMNLTRIDVILNMKLLLSISLLLVFSASQAQTLKYDQLFEGGSKPSGPFSEYVSKVGETYAIGDTLQLGVGSGLNGTFVHVGHWNMLGSQLKMIASYTGTITVIRKIRIVGTRKSGWKAQFATSGPRGASQFFFAFEDASAAGEVKGKGMTSDQALEELTKAKKMLDLEVITQDEYDKKKADLIKYINR
jgi:hypothetical protein